MTTGEGATGAASIRDGCLKAWLPLAPAPLRSVADAAVPCVRSTAWGEVEPPVRARVKATPRAKLAASVMMLAPFLRQLPSWCRCPAMLSLALAWRLLLFHVTDRNACPVPLSQLTHFTCTCVSRNLCVQSICGILFLMSSGARPASLAENRWVANPARAACPLSTPWCPVRQHPEESRLSQCKTAMLDSWACRRAFFAAGGRLVPPFRGVFLWRLSGLTELAKINF